MVETEDEEIQMVRVTVIGAGAIGMLLTYRLLEAGYQVELITKREEQAKRISLAGVTLTGGGTVYPKACSMEACSALPFPKKERHYLLLTVKQTAMTDAFAARVKEMMGEGSRVICWQNGLGHDKVLARHIDANRIWLTVTTEGALKATDTEVAHTGHGVTWLGPILNGGSEGEPEQKVIREMLMDAGFQLFLSNEIINRVWQKLIINAVINPLTALLQVNNGALPFLPEAQPLMRALYEEARGLADRAGIHLDPDLWETVLEVCRQTQDNRSSMLQDVLAGRQTEIEAINGALLDKAREEGVRIPTHETIFRLVKALEGVSPARG